MDRGGKGPRGEEEEDSILRRALPLFSRGWHPTPVENGHV